jgi:hypothetical protein
MHLIPGVAMPGSPEIDAVKHIMATLFSAQNALRSIAAEFKWAGLGNLLGDYGEYVAIRHYGLTKAPPGSDRLMWGQVPHFA